MTEGCRQKDQDTKGSGLGTHIRKKKRRMGSKTVIETEGRREWDARIQRRGKNDREKGKDEEQKRDEE